MLKKLKEMSIKADMKIRNAMYKFANEEKGGAEIVAILLIIIVLIAVVVVFRNGLSKLITDFFTKIKTDTDAKLP